MDLVMTFVILIGALWLAGYGTAMIVSQHGRYVAWTRRGLRSFWNHNRTRIIWFAIGFLCAAMLLSPGPT
ncbi:MAG: hypothetical protein Q8O98_00435 [bacterium]|nr:hypothetical protein [bacterium]